MTLNKHNLIGTYLKKKRLQSQLSQRDVAVKLGYGSAQFISNIERGEASIPPKMAKKLIQILKLSEKEVIQVLVRDYEHHLRSQIAKRL